jgi:hypothetical protein
MQNDEIRRKTTHHLLHFPIRLPDRSIPIDQARVGDDGRIVVDHFVGLLLVGGGGGGGGVDLLLLPLFLIGLAARLVPAVGVKVVDPEDDSGKGSLREMDRFFGKIGFLELIVRMGSHMN